jgi:hypothetical protein
MRVVTRSINPLKTMFHLINIQGVPRGTVNILGGHTVGHSKEKSVYVHMSHSERFPR